MKPGIVGIAASAACTLGSWKAALAPLNMLPGPLLLAPPELIDEKRVIAIVMKSESEMYCHLPCVAISPMKYRLPPVIRHSKLPAIFWPPPLMLALMVLPAWIAVIAAIGLLE